jgi:hypothetical protein
MIKKVLLFLLILIFSKSNTGNIVICTVSDELYFDPLINLIGSIHKINFDDLKEICVYDLGMTNQQIEKLNSIQKVKVYQIEKVHPKLLKPVVIDVHGKSVRGWYAWKPVVIKQTMDMHGSIIYLDAGNTVLKPLNDLFAHIEENGYFFIAGAHNIKDWTTKRVIKYFNLEDEDKKFVLNDATKSISANIMGFSPKIYDSIVLPMYKHVKNDFYLFEDDGSSNQGFGKHRHDQTLFSIYIRLLNLKVFEQNFSLLNVNGKKKIFHTHFYRHMLTNSSIIYQSRWDLTFGGQKTNDDEPFYVQFIKYKNN